MTTAPLTPPPADRAERLASTWRRTPPTVDEVRACRWWWIRPPDRDPQPICIDDDSARFGGWDDDLDWAPCLPPDGAR